MPGKIIYPKNEADAELRCVDGKKGCWEEGKAGGKIACEEKVRILPKGPRGEKKLTPAELQAAFKKQK